MAIKGIVPFRPREGGDERGGVGVADAMYGAAPGSGTGILSSPPSTPPPPAPPTRPVPVHAPLFSFSAAGRIQPQPQPQPQPQIPTAKPSEINPRPRSLVRFKKFPRPGRGYISPVLIFAGIVLRTAERSGVGW